MRWRCPILAVVVVVLGWSRTGSCATLLDAAISPPGTSLHIDQAVILTTINCSCCDDRRCFRVRDDTRAMTLISTPENIERILASRSVGDVIAFDAVYRPTSGLCVLEPSNVWNVPSPTISRSTEPLIVELGDFASYNPAAEALESNLVTMNHVRFVDVPAGTRFARADYTITDGSFRAKVKVPRADMDMIGQVIPLDWLDLTGIFGQVDPNSGPTLPGEGYHLQLLSRSGITVIPEPEMGAIILAAYAPLLLLGRSRRSEPQ